MFDLFVSDVLAMKAAMSPDDINVGMHSVYVRRGVTRHNKQQTNICEIMGN